MKYRFKSVPANPTNVAESLDVRDHEIEIRMMERYRTPSWISVLVFAVSGFAVGMFLSFLARKGYLTVSSDGQGAVALFSALILATSCFLAISEAELQFVMRTRAFQDRNIDWAELKLFQVRRVKD